MKIKWILSFVVKVWITKIGGKIIASCFARIKSWHKIKASIKDTGTRGFHKRISMD